MSQLPTFGVHNRDPYDVAITNVDQLVDVFKNVEKKSEDSMIGVEYEFFALDTKSLSPLPFTGALSIQTLFSALIAEGMTGIYEDDVIVALKGKDAIIALEPGGQIELAAHPKTDLISAVATLSNIANQVNEVGKTLGIVFLAMGIEPNAAVSDMAHVKKKRYDIMRRYMASLGGRGFDMMTRASATQVNLDYSDEQDMVKKMRVAAILCPMFQVLLSNSPFIDGKPTRHALERADVWQKTDKDRVGLPPFIFEKAFGYRDYIEWVLDVPMYFVRRGELYLDATGSSFRSFMHHGLKGETATVRDFVDHLSTVFTDVRLKPILELRSMDSAPLSYINGLQALIWNIFYQPKILDEVDEWFLPLDVEDLQNMKTSATSHGFLATLKGKTIYQWLNELLETVAMSMNSEHRPLLDPLFLILKKGKSLSDAYKERYSIVDRTALLELTTASSLMGKGFLSVS